MQSLKRRSNRANGLSSIRDARPPVTDSPRCTQARALARSTRSATDVGGITRRRELRRLSHVFGHELHYDSSKITIVRHKPKGTVPELRHGLERVVDDPGVCHWLRDPATGDYNFDRRLATLPQPDEVRWDQLGRFIPASKDADLIARAKAAKRSLAGSSSSLGTALQSLVLLIAGNFARPSFAGLSNAYAHLGSLKTPLQDCVMQVTPVDGVHCITSLDSGAQSVTDDGAMTGMEDVLDPPSNVDLLSQIGHIGEALLVSDLDGRVRWKRDPARDAKKLSPPKLCHTYSSNGPLFMRSQLDGQSKGRLLDIKHRGVLPMRYDILERDAYLKYRINSLEGPANSFEREIFDLIRKMYITWSIQARMGGMDGILASFHNSREIFGFRYFPIAEIDAAALTSSRHAEASYSVATSLLGEVLRQSVDYFRETPFLVAMPRRDASETERFIIARSIGPVDQNARLLGFKLTCTRSHYEDQTAQWNVACVLAPLSSDVVRNRWRSYQPVENSSRYNVRSYTLPAALVRRLTDEDLDTIDRHNDGLLDGRITVGGGALTLAAGSRYVLQPSALTRKLRSTGQILPTNFLERKSAA